MKRTIQQHIDSEESIKDLLKEKNEELSAVYSSIQNLQNNRAFLGVQIRVAARKNLETFDADIFMIEQKKGFRLRQLVSRFRQYEIL